MDNKVLRAIIADAKRRLTNSYGFCGILESDKLAILNSNDRQGNDIEIRITSTKE